MADQIASLFRPGSQQSRSRRFDGKTMPWGKHVGKPLGEVPFTYIAWIFDEHVSGNMSLPEPLAEALFDAFAAHLAKLPVYARKLVTSPAPPAKRPVVLDDGGDDRL